MNLGDQNVQPHPDSSKYPDGDPRNARDLRDNDLLRRAFAAYYSFDSKVRQAYRMKHRETHPDASYSWVNKYPPPDNREYVILANMKGPLAVYQVQKRDLLKRLESYDPGILTLALDFSVLD